MDVAFITGTDEHGEKIALAAQSRGMEPLDHCDAIVDLYKKLWFALNIKYDNFVRTTSKSHEVFVLEVLNKVWENGDIYLDQYEGWYCVDCEEYKDETGMNEETHTCVTHRKECTFRKEVREKVSLCLLWNATDKMGWVVLTANADNITLFITN